MVARSVYALYLILLSLGVVGIAHMTAGGGSLHWIDWGTCTNGHCVSHGTN